MRLHRAHRFFHRAAEIAPADAVFDGDVAGVILAIDHRSAILDADVAELAQGHALAAGREHADVLDVLDRPAIRFLVADDEIVATLTIEDLRHSLAANSRF